MGFGLIWLLSAVHKADVDRWAATKVHHRSVLGEIYRISRLPKYIRVQAVRDNWDLRIKEVS